MAKKVIKLTESELKEMIKNATLQALDKQLLAENRNFERAKKAVRTYCNPRDNDEIFVIHFASPTSFSTSAKQEYIPNQSYSVIEIKNFSNASNFSKCVDWCIVRSKFDFETYTTHGETFYFCLKDGYEKISYLKGEGHPLDNYGLSMITVSVRKNGRFATCTTRWNESSNGSRILTPQQISQLLGMDFYSVFKPKR